MHKPYKNREFKVLRDEWYKKLKDDGFKDIEDTNSPKEFLLSWSSRFYTQKNGSFSQLREDAALEYYTRASEFLINHEFLCETDKTVWTLHSDGLSLREIAKIGVFNEKNQRLSKDVINRIVRRLAQTMKDLHK